ncbi:MAG: SUMF1/EgtB/PvdO family nonheme iron enzyme [Planctomycetes bacterium]|nr:SUMF1/EgtB/PvdO family nonheme iron enzyme [Planctomycetota bacterium]
MARKPPSPKSPGDVQVFLSSTYRDNEARRKKLFEAIARLGMRVAGMELFTSASQPAKDKCVEVVRASTVFVGVLAHRYGWEPKGEKRSITRIEYEEAGAAGIPRLMFLISDDVPIVADRDYDEPAVRWDKQKLLADFKRDVRANEEECSTPFDSDEQLCMQVMQALNEWFESTRAPAKPATNPRTRSRAKPSGSALDREVADYLRRMSDAHGQVRLVGFGKHVHLNLDLEELLVPQNALVDRRAIGKVGFDDAEHAERGVSGNSDLIALADAFRRVAEKKSSRGFVLLGDPGSGKTTQLKRLLLWVARNGPESVGLPAGMVPLFLPLRELRSVDDGLEPLIEAQLSSPHYKPKPGFARRMLERGNLLLLFDGLDEVADEKQRERVAKWIEQAADANHGWRIAVTCRYAGYSELSRLDGRFLELHLRPLSDDQADDFIAKWFRAVEREQERDQERADLLADEGARKLIETLKGPHFGASRVYEFTRNPLLLTAICLVHYDKKSLPERRADLYEQCVDVLLERWRAAKGISVSMDAKKARGVLQPLAYWMHLEPQRRRATPKEIAPQIARSLSEIQWKDSAERFLATIRDESGLLVGWSERDFGFLHLGFQEYLAAREIRRRYFEEDDSQALSDLADRFGDPWWREVTLLLVALEEPSLFEPLFAEVVKRDEFATSQDLVSYALTDAVRVSPRPFVELLDLPPGRDRKLWERQLAALRVLEKIAPQRVAERAPSLARHRHAEIAMRFQVPASRPIGVDSPPVRVSVSAPPGTVELCGSAVIGVTSTARIEDVATPRIRSARGEIDFVAIPGGKFWMGSTDQEIARLKRELPSLAEYFDRESPRHEVTISAFFLAPTPVTNSQYVRFLAATHDAVKPEYWADRRYNQPEQPVVGVSWEDAQRFCEWAGVRLPTEAQWEYACRAGTDTRYWSGDKESDLERVGWLTKNSGAALQSVGRKPANPFGLHDLHGNVWEWCADWYGKYSKNPQSDPAGPASGSSRVVRGGGFEDGVGRCRSAFRNRRHPSDRWDDLGFRVALPAAPSSR